MPPPPPVFSLSIVSHAQGGMIRDLLSDLKSVAGAPVEIILTINIPEDESYFAGYDGPPLKIIRNQAVRGFGANHNAAFEQAQGEFFVVTNPDIRASALDLGPLLAALHEPRVGAVGPRVVSPGGVPEDSPRHFPTFRRLAARVLSGRRDPDYLIGEQPLSVDWVGGMLVAFRNTAFRAIGGFDERYFMYLEDVDICRRLHDAGWDVLFQPRVEVVHNAQRQSHRNLQHISWHLRSMARYLFLYRITKTWHRP